LVGLDFILGKIQKYDEQKRKIAEETLICKADIN
jgi:hypothetical protein